MNYRPLFIHVSPPLKHYHSVLFHEARNIWQIRMTKRHNGINARVSTTITDERAPV
jgi:hypothetical protein